MHGCWLPYIVGWQLFLPAMVLDAATPVLTAYKDLVRIHGVFRVRRMNVSTCAMRKHLSNAVVTGIPGIFFRNFQDCRCKPRSSWPVLYVGGNNLFDHRVRMEIQNHFSPGTFWGLLAAPFMNGGSPRRCDTETLHSKNLPCCCN